MADTMVFVKHALIGGGADALDTIDGTDRGDANPLQDGDVGIVLVPSGEKYFYLLDDDSAAAESSPDIIRPDTNAGDKRWILCNSPYILSGTGAAPSPTGIPEGAIYFKYTA